MRLFTCGIASHVDINYNAVACVGYAFDSVIIPPKFQWQQAAIA